MMSRGICSYITRCISEKVQSSAKVTTEGEY